MKKLRQADFTKQDRVKVKTYPTIVGQILYCGKEKAEVAVRGGPSCHWSYRDMELVGRPVDDGFEAYFGNELVGTAADWAGVMALRRTAREAKAIEPETR